MENRFEKSNNDKQVKFESEKMTKEFTADMFDMIKQKTGAVGLAGVFVFSDGSTTGFGQAFIEPEIMNPSIRDRWGTINAIMKMIYYTYISDKPLPGNGE